MQVHWITLIIAIVAEVIASSSLKATDGFTKLIPTIVVIIGYITSFYFLSLTLKTLPMGIAYAVWSGLGIILISLIGFVVYKQYLETASIIGIIFIIIGVVIIQIFSNNIN